MVDFTYSELEFVVPVGSEVTWFNTGEVDHSATDADGAWDTTLLANGEQASIILDTPGIFTYFCTLHGTADGQGMAAQITVVEEDGQPPPAAEPEEGAPEGGPTAEPTAEPPTPEPAAPAEVTVDMVDFTYEPVEVTVPAGTTIVWVNTGDFDHSATADDRSWDTGEYGTGQRAGITFDTPGAYQYFCTLHGSPGGNGMSGTVTVTEE
jgi:plastocyanin